MNEHVVMAQNIAWFIIEFYYFKRNAHLRDNELIYIFIIIFVEIEQNDFGVMFNLSTFLFSIELDMQTHKSQLHDSHTHTK